ncbi:hypothetical protein FRC12_015608 [Ceratobasidium sp. 428]|nr:hypothetical protein FRC12_015608 [Ceratobasidium sp. 428]
MTHKIPTLEDENVLPELRILRASKDETSDGLRRVPMTENKGAQRRNHQASKHGSRTAIVSIITEAREGTRYTDYATAIFSNRQRTNALGQSLPGLGMIYARFL